jgi:hypothetical protein
MPINIKNTISYRVVSYIISYISAMIDLPASVSAQWHLLPQQCCLFQPARSQFWQSAVVPTALSTELSFRPPVTDLTSTLTSRRILSQHFTCVFSSHAKHKTSEPIAELHYYRNNKDYDKRPGIQTDTVLPSFENSSTLILRRNCIYLKRPCLLINSARRQRDLGSSLWGLRHKPILRVASACTYSDSNLITAEKLRWIPKQKGARGRPKKNWMEGVRKAMNERNLQEGQWEDRKQWSLGVGQRERTFWNRLIYI